MTLYSLTLLLTTFYSRLQRYSTSFRIINTPGLAASFCNIYPRRYANNNRRLLCCPNWKLKANLFSQPKTNSITQLTVYPNMNCCWQISSLKWNIFNHVSKFSQYLHHFYKLWPFPIYFKISSELHAFFF